jgi:hypothetical protein
VSISRDAGAHNITWVFHVAAHDTPPVEGNRIKDYYPGSEWVDWLAVSVYGAQEVGDRWEPFDVQLTSAVARLARCAPGKPIIVAEMGGRSDAPEEQRNWVNAAFTELLGWGDKAGASRSRLIGFAWWNSPQMEMHVEKHAHLADLLEAHLMSDRILDRTLVEDAPARAIPARARPGCD